MDRCFRGAPSGEDAGFDGGHTAPEDAGPPIGCDTGNTCVRIPAQVTSILSRQSDCHPPATTAAAFLDCSACDCTMTRGECTANVELWNNQTCSGTASGPTPLGPGCIDTPDLIGSTIGAEAHNLDSAVAATCAATVPTASAFMRDFCAITTGGACDPGDGSPGRCLPVAAPGIDCVVIDGGACPNGFDRARETVYLASASSTTCNCSCETGSSSCVLHLYPGSNGCSGADSETPMTGGCDDTTATGAHSARLDTATECTPSGLPTNGPSPITLCCS